MYSLKVDRNSSGDKGIWGYTLSKDGEILKKEVINGRERTDDTNVLRYVRCYTWAVEAVGGYFQTNDTDDDTILTFCFTSKIIGQWLATGHIPKEYRIEFDVLMKAIDNIPLTIRFCNVNREWAFRRLLVEGNVQHENYQSITSFLGSFEE